ncbi:MAG: Ig-like domain-containing protein, partial [Prevotellaceae bacterium]|nr:Ig-like domain-containing protein [Prevotellaceae bacterium]
MKKTIYSILTLVMGLVLCAGTCSGPDPVPVAVTGITLHLTATTRAPGATFKITETVLPANATDKSVQWSSNNPGVATVDPNTGLITVKSTATSPFTCTITAITVSGGKVATCEITVAQNLGTNTLSLGTVTRGSERKIGAQIWSDVVFASLCNKTSWDPGTSSIVKADGCRPSGAASSVTYFTWAAVVRYQDQLCPYPWRVPTKDDLVTLFQYLGGTGTSGGSFPGVRDNLVLQTSNGWGGAYGGNCNSGGSLNYQGLGAFYWSQSEYSA